MRLQQFLQEDMAGAEDHLDIEDHLHRVFRMYTNDDERIGVLTRLIVRERKQGYEQGYQDGLDVSDPSVETDDVPYFLKKQAD